jgi:hypothetical protein
MAQRYAGRGLVCMSVSIDTPDRHEAARAFLRSQGAAFANYRLDEKEAFWQEKWDINAPPAVYVFDREGRWVRFDCSDPDKPFTYADVEKLVQRLLR